MDINLIRLKPVVRELRSIANVLTRIAEALEADLMDRQIQVPSKINNNPNSSEKPAYFVTNEEEDYIREMEEALERQQGKSKDPEDE